MSAYTSTTPMIQLMADLLAQSFVAEGKTFKEALATAPQNLQDDPHSVEVFRGAWEKATANIPNPIKGVVDDDDDC